MQEAEINADEGERNLAALLKNLNPTLDEQPYVFVSIPSDDERFIPNFPIKGLFREREGYTCIIEQRIADHNGLEYSALFCCLTCEVHSSLEAVGLTAAISAVLAEHDISANIVAGYYHDHIFIPQADARRAVAVLKNI
ncbi:ACT domain-containing protein [Alteromonas sp. ASW11-130]|uniref:ACT domain-containing protein n=1 Tax=Alteromonas sp. ASW11-130 TaxID=3015775 RepID=UPI0022426667|nr:ACT domain-containing protein [Alteromonas sp. ASW11-130]MCW8090735.1 ACT domain-containing protein [Alteromonas sp. ASW11-130]